MKKESKQEREAAEDYFMPTTDADRKWWAEEEAREARLCGAWCAKECCTPINSWLDGIGFAILLNVIVILVLALAGG